jgi:hypothetical protein
MMTPHVATLAMDASLRKMPAPTAVTKYYNAVEGSRLYEHPAKTVPKNSVQEQGPGAHVAGSLFVHGAHHLAHVGPNARVVRPSGHHVGGGAPAYLLHCQEELHAAGRGAGVQLGAQLTP